MSYKSTLSQDPVNKVCQQKRNGNVNLFHFLKFWIRFRCFIASLGINSKTRQACFVTFLLWRILKKNLFAPLQAEKNLNQQRLAQLVPDSKTSESRRHCIFYPTVAITPNGFTHSKIYL